MVNRWSFADSLYPDRSRLGRPVRRARVPIVSAYAAAALTTVSVKADTNAALS
jgi:hypothetical protein